MAAALLAVALAAALAWAGRIAWQAWDDLEPTRAPVDPAGRAALGAEAVTLRTSDGLALSGWYAPSRDGLAVLFVHGLGATRAQFLGPAAALAARGTGVLLFDLRAHGESQGRRTSLGRLEQRDVAAAVAFLAGRPEVRRIAGVGFSVGGMALALEAADDPRVAAVALVGAFDSLEAMVKLHETWARARVELWTLAALGLEPFSIRPGEVLCRLAPRPLLLLFGDGDPAWREAGRLRARACGPVRVALLPGAHHEDFAQAAGPALTRELGDFLDGARP